jgi:hypothetical protein
MGAYSHLRRSLSSASLTTVANCSSSALAISAVIITRTGTGGAFVLFVRFTRARGGAERGAANLGRALDRAAGRFLFGEFFLT